MDTDNACIIALLCHHLALLDRGDTVLGIKDHDAGTRNIRKPCHGSFACIAAGRRQDDDLLLLIILAGGSGQKVRQDLQRHILESDRRPVEKFEQISVIRFADRYDLLIIKIMAVGIFNAVLQLFLCEIGEHELHNFIGNAAVIHPGQIREAFVKRRKFGRDKKASVCRKPHKDCFRSRDRKAVRARTFI